MSRALLRKERHIGIETVVGPNATTKSAVGTVTQVPTDGRHFGFLTVTGVSAQVIASQRIIKESGKAEFFLINARVHCTIEDRGERGWRVTKIHAISI